MSEKLSGVYEEEYVFAHILRLLCKHCMTPGGELDSGGVPFIAALMTFIIEEGGGEIETTGEFGGRVFAKVTPEGHELLERLRAQEPDCS
jgi:hypothetical protein